MTSEQPSKFPTREISQHADLLNVLDAMAGNLHYSVRRQEIRQAESLIVEQERELIDLRARLAAAERERDAATGECAALRELAERLIKDVDGLEFYYYAKAEYERWLEMRYTNGANGPVVIKPGIGAELLARLAAAERLAYETRPGLEVPPLGNDILGSSW